MSGVDFARWGLSLLFFFECERQFFGYVRVKGKGQGRRSRAKIFYLWRGGGDGPAEVRLLIARIHQQDVPLSVVLRTELVIREST